MEKREETHASSSTSKDGCSSEILRYPTRPRSWKARCESAYPSGGIGGRSLRVKEEEEGVVEGEGAAGGGGEGGGDDVEAAESEEMQKKGRRVSKQGIESVGLTGGQTYLNWRIPSRKARSSKPANSPPSMRKRRLRRMGVWR